eukprot:11752487-Prorocentrum_lima.AAC.1
MCIRDSLVQEPLVRHRDDRVEAIHGGSLQAPAAVLEVRVRERVRGCVFVFGRGRGRVCGCVCVGVSVCVSASGGMVAVVSSKCTQTVRGCGAPGG